jgi:transcriptional regulator with XRE-family HTH domain
MDWREAMSEARTVTTYAALLGAVLCHARTAQNAKQSDIASAVGVGPSTWSRIERGESSLSTDQLKAAADFLQMSPARILKAVEAAEEETAARGIQCESVIGGHRLAASDAVALGLVPVVGNSLGLIVGGAVAAAGGIFASIFD